ncbi:MAG: HNH endonuclease [Polyangia bacterium]
MKGLALKAIRFRRCIYCLEEKPPDDFNREHVIPQAFGRFAGQSPTLDCVCRLCNSSLGRELDESLSYKSIEGVHRFISGLRDAGQFRADRASDIDRVEIGEGPLAGCVADFGSSPDGTSVNMVPRPQVGFAKTEDGPFQWHPVGVLPTKEQLQKEFGPTPPSIRVVGAADEREVQQELASKGLMIGEMAVGHLPSGTAYAEIVATITQKHLRAIAKIAFNYLAFVRPGLAYLPEFNEVRRYVLAGADPSASTIQSIVPRPAHSPGRLKWHAISVACLNSTVAALVLPLGIGSCQRE